MAPTPPARPAEPERERPQAVHTMLIAEGFHDREWAGAGSGAMLPPPDSPTQSAPEPPMIPPPPWSPLYQGDEHVELPEPEPEPEPGTQPPPRVEIPKPPWAEEER